MMEVGRRLEYVVRDGWSFLVGPFSAFWEHRAQIKFDIVTSNPHPLKLKTVYWLLFWYFQFQVSGHPSERCKHFHTAAIIRLFKSGIMLFPRNSVLALTLSTSK